VPQKRRERKLRSALSLSLAFEMRPYTEIPDISTCSLDEPDALICPSVDPTDVRFAICPSQVRPMRIRFKTKS